MNLNDFARTPVQVEHGRKTITFYYNPMLATGELLGKEGTIAEALTDLGLAWDMKETVDGEERPVPIERAYAVVGLAPKVWEALLEDLSPNSASPGE